MPFAMRETQQLGSRLIELAVRPPRHLFCADRGPGGRGHCLPADVCGRVDSDSLLAGLGPGLWSSCCVNRACVLNGWQCGAARGETRSDSLPDTRAPVSPGGVCQAVCPSHLRHVPREALLRHAFVWKPFDHHVV